MDAGVVGKRYLPNMVLRVKRVILGLGCEHGPVEPFNKAITLRVVRFCPGFLDLQEIADVLDELRLELSPLV